MARRTDLPEDLDERAAAPTDDARLAETVPDLGRPVGGPPSVRAGFGRYRILRLVGEGGMGAVFAAHDPELDRTVAVKVLRANLTLTGSSGEELRREAQIMARIAHPNVIHVYDAGVADGRAFVAMEYVAGGTLSDWLGRAPRTAAEILGAFAQAGEGLGAAHAAGLVHRDFKPSNVLCADDGRVLVTDFGLARPSTGAEADGGAGGAAVVASGPAVGASGARSGEPLYVTVTGPAGVVGTPAFMAPEQHAGRRVDARADQFSFCVSLWRALAGVMPFAGERAAELAAAKANGRFEAVPASSALGPRIQRVLERGLAADPAARFPSMHELLAALGDEARRRSRARLRAGTVVVLVLIAGAATAWTLARRSNARHAAGGAGPCVASTDRFAGVWDDDARRAVAAAFAKTGVPYADTASREVARQLDARKLAWEAMRRQSCEATRVRKEQSDAAMDLRAACLERRFAELAAFVTELRTADARVVDGASQGAGTIGDVTACGDAVVLARRTAAPAGQRAAIEALSPRVAALRARVEAGREHGADADADALVADARAVAFPPLLAEALLLAGRIHDEGDDDAAGAAKLYEEASLAAEAGGDDELRFEVELRLARVTGYLLEKDQEGMSHADRAAALLARMGNDPRREAALLRTRATIDWHHGRYDLAKKTAGRAVELLEQVDPTGADMALSLQVWGRVFDDLMEDADALGIFERGKGVAEKALGAEHRVTAGMWKGMGGSLRRLHRYEESEQALRRALAIFEATSGPDSLDVAAVYANLGNLYGEQRQEERALEAFQRAEEITERAVGPEHSLTGDALERYGQSLAKLKRPSAEAVLLRAIAIHRARLGADHPVTSATVRKLGEYYEDNGQPAKAVPLFEEAIRALVASQGETSSLLVNPLLSLADTEIALGHPDKAIAALERALPLAVEGKWRSRVELALAQALRKAHRDPERAKALAESARVYYLADPDGKKDVAEIDAWLAGK